MDRSSAHVFRNAVAITTVFLLLDRGTKIVFAKNDFSFFLFHPAFLRFVHHENHGIIANIPIPQIIIILVTFFLLLIVLGLLVRAVHQKKMRAVSFLSLLCAGALGNFWDRVAHGVVFDWILVFNRSAINIADICIIVGLIGFLLQKEHAPQSVDTTH